MTAISSADGGVSGGIGEPGDYGWRDGDRVVPAYAFTLGRTRSAGQELPLEALVTATQLAVEHLPALQVECRAIVRMSMRPTSVMEIGAALHVPAGVARVLVSELASAGLLVLYLFGAPGQDRFWFIWDELARGAVGAVVLVDLRRLNDCFPAIDYFEDRRFLSRWRSTSSRVARLDARQAHSILETLVTLAEHALARAA